MGRALGKREQPDAERVRRRVERVGPLDISAESFGVTRLNPGLYKLRQMQIAKRKTKVRS